MKKTFTLISCVVAVAMMASASEVRDKNWKPPTAEELERRRQQARQWEEREQQRQALEVRKLEEAKAGDDNALREWVFIFGGIFRQRYDGGGIILVNNGISRERVVRVLDAIVRENLPDGKERKDGPGLYLATQMLARLPGDDVLALFEEYVKTEHRGVRYDMTNLYNDVKEEMRKQQEKQKEAATEPPPEKPTEPPSEKPTEKPPEKPTEKPKEGGN